MLRGGVSKGHGFSSLRSTRSMTALALAMTPRAAVEVRVELLKLLHFRFQELPQEF
jgi:hypothetical protein